MKSFLISHKITVPCCAWSVAALLVLTAPLVDAESGTPTELDLQQKELELKKKEVDLEKQKLEIEAAKKELQAHETEKNLTINLQGDVAFDSGQAVLRPEGETSLDEIVVQK